MKKYKKLILNIIPFLILLVCFSGFYHLHSNQVITQFIHKNKAISKNIARNIEDANNHIARSLKNAILALSEKLDHKNIYNYQDLSKLRDMLGLTIITLWDGNTGKMFSDTKHKVSFGKNKPEYFMNYSIFGRKYSGYDLKNLKNHSTLIKVFPLRKTKLGNILNKMAFMYNKKIDKYITAHIEADDIMNIIVRNQNLHKDIVSLILRDPNDVIASTAAYDKEDFNSNDFFINNSVLFDTVESEPYYTLTAVFSKSQLNHQLLILKLIYATFFLISSGLAVMIRQHISNKDDIRLALKKQT